MPLVVSASLVPTTSGVGVELNLHDPATGANWSKRMTALQYAEAADSLLLAMEHISRRLYEVQLESATEACEAVDKIQRMKGGKR
jgi:hypothetical protein